MVLALHDIYCHILLPKWKKDLVWIPTHYMITKKTGLLPCHVMNSRWYCWFSTCVQIWWTHKMSLSTQCHWLIFRLVASFKRCSRNTFKLSWMWWENGTCFCERVPKWRRVAYLLKPYNQIHSKKTFNDMTKASKLKGISRESFKSHTNPEIIFRWALALSNVCEDVNIENILAHLVGPIPSLFHEDGTMGKTCKSDLMHLF